VVPPPAMKIENTLPKYQVVSQVELTQNEEHQKYNVLHLDDDRYYLAVTKTILEQSADITVEVIDSPLKAVEMALDGYYSVFITDIQMPGMSGYEVIEAVRTVDDEIPIIILSSDLNPGKIKHYKNVFALSKHGEPELVYDQIRRLIYLLGSDAMMQSKICGIDNVSRIKRIEEIYSLMDHMNIHDLRNQISIQESLLDFLLDQYKELPELSKYLTKILQTSEQIQTIIDSANNPQYRLSGPQWLNIVDAFQPAVIRAEQKGIVTSIDDHEIEIFADPFFDRIFSILVENSIMYGETVTTISVTMKQSGSELLLIYEDNGKGIPIKEKESIFVKGYGSNTGQGLFFVKSLLAMTGISIEETGKPGKGARFELRIRSNQFREKPVNVQ